VALDAAGVDVREPNLGDAGSGVERKFDSVIEADRRVHHLDDEENVPRAGMAAGI
jgi:hypothetical protein